MTPCAWPPACAPTARWMRSDRARALDCLARFGQRIAGVPTIRVRAVATNSVRRLASPQSFLTAAEAALGHPVEIVSGREEGRLIFLGSSHDLPASRETSADYRRRRRQYGVHHRTRLRPIAHGKRAGWLHRLHAALLPRRQAQSQAVAARQRRNRRACCSSLPRTIANRAGSKPTVPPVRPRPSARSCRR